MLLVGIGSVSAENIDDSDLSAIDNVTDEVNSADYSIDDNLNADEQDSLSGSRSPGDVNSWTDLESKVNSGPDTLTITSSLTSGKSD